MRIPTWARPGHRAWRPAAERRAMARGMRGRFSIPVEQAHEAGRVFGVAQVVPADARRAGIDAARFLRSDGEIASELVFEILSPQLVVLSPPWPPASAPTTTRYRLEAFVVAIDRPDEMRLEDIERAARMHLGRLLNGEQE